MDEFDAYLDKHKGADEFDSFLAQHAQSGPTEKTSAGMAALEHYGNTASMGYLPHLQAGVEKLLPNPTADVDAALKAEGFSVPSNDQGYISARDENIKRLETQSKEHPVASGIGTGLGIAAGALMPAAQISKTAGLGAKMLQGAKTGALYGAIANPGDTEGEYSPVQLGGRAKNVAIGAGIGAAAPAVVAGVEKSGSVVKDYLKKKAALKATRALGRPTPTEAARMAATGEDVALGRELLDEGAIPYLGTPGRIQGRVEKLKAAAGDEIANLIDSADAQRVEYTPIKIKKYPKGKVLKEEVRGTPIRFDENPARRIDPTLRADDAPPSLIRGEEQILEHEIRSAPMTEVIPGSVKSAPIASVDTKKIADNIINSAELKLMRNTPGMESTVAAIEKQVETLAKNGKLTLAEAQKLRQGIDKSINFNKSAPDMRGAQEGLYRQRTAIRNAMSDAIDSLPGNSEKGALLKANRKYGRLADASDILEKEIGRDQANRSISLTDTIAGAAGASTGNPAAALALGAANKFGRTFGNSIQARVYDSIAKKAGLVPGAMEKVNPQVASMIAQRAALRDPRFQENDDPILKDPQLLELFRKDPGLIDSIADETRRTKIKRSIAAYPKTVTSKKSDGR